MFFDKRPPAEPKTPEQLDVQDMIKITSRLARLLADEVDMLGAMKIESVNELQQEKQMLTAGLEAHRRMLSRHPHLSETIPSQDREELKEVVRIFENILEENHRRLLVAREVNRCIAQSVARVLQEKAVGRVYDGRGGVNRKQGDGISFTLNQKA